MRSWRHTIFAGLWALFGLCLLFIAVLNMLGKIKEGPGPPDDNPAEPGGATGGGA